MLQLQRIRGIKGSRNAKCDGFRNIDVTSGSRVKLERILVKIFHHLLVILKYLTMDANFNNLKIAARKQSIQTS